ncbi:hypothetical protein [Cryptosporangium phraense]|uniref:Uncharacterized protein n=1 Tax=Cryptosporangium phraense TaxID=2593070 RepID=A0A545B065_9ACTN|nr:hypothetical protein [Cryptosporangium phraense]TQS46944.1 hypothetical protein FL583_01325 [Cryptosporangium phraense]
MNQPPRAGRSTVPVVPPVQARKLAKVPFVEPADGRLQGVVSSGSDVERVYVSSIVAGTLTYHCSTNNNRPCGGLRGSPCNHLRLLIDEAALQYGYERVARYLGVDPVEVPGPLELGRSLSHHEPSAGAGVFSRFLRHLAYLELPGSVEPLPELAWFPAVR